MHNGLHLDIRIDRSTAIGQSDAALAYESTIVFRKGADTALLWANTLEDASGKASVTIKPDELEDLARIAAPRM